MRDARGASPPTPFPNCGGLRDRLFFDELKRDAASPEASRARSECAHRKLARIGGVVGRDLFDGGRVIV